MPDTLTAFVASLVWMPELSYTRTDASGFHPSAAFGVRNERATPYASLPELDAARKPRTTSSGVIPGSGGCGIAR